MRDEGLDTALLLDQVAEARYRAFGLTLRSTILARRSEPPPIAAVNDD